MAASVMASASLRPTPFRVEKAAPTGLLSLARTCSLRIEASGGKKIETDKPYGINGSMNLKDGVDASYSKARTKRNHSTAGNRDFEVTVSKKNMVAAALSLQDHRLPLSNLDLILPPIEFCVFFCYNQNTGSNDKTNSDSMVNLLKKALSETLVSYYAFAGEIMNNNRGELELLCNNNGVEFFEAYADIKLNELNLHKLDESIYKLFPNKKQGVMAVQATRLECGSLIVSCLFDHRIVDAYSANLFLVSWAEIARSKPISIVPSFRRSLLSPRNPLKFDASIDDMYMPLPALPPSKETSQANGDREFQSRLYYIESYKINELQALASSNGSRVTKFEAFSAFLWKLIAKSAEKLADTKTSTLGIAVDGRRRIVEGDGGENTNNMASYIGNLLSCPFRGHQVKDIVEKPLHWLANEVHCTIQTSVTKEHFLALIDWIEAQRPKPIMPKIYQVGDGPDFVVSSGQRFPVTEVDFGWGPPVLGSYSFAQWGGTIGYGMPMPSATRDGDWVVYMLLRKGQLDSIEEDTSDVFKPMSHDYIDKVAVYTNVG